MKEKRKPGRPSRRPVLFERFAEKLPKLDPGVHAGFPTPAHASENSRNGFDSI
jgi:hypothetical protein